MPRHDLHQHLWPEPPSEVDLRAYEMQPDGGLRRHSMSYAEELRPI